MDWINSDSSVFILLEDLQSILDRNSKLPFSIMEHFSMWW